MISLDNFTALISALEETLQKNEEFGDIMSLYMGPDCNFELCFPLSDRVVDFLVAEFQDTDEWLYWWIYEKSFGRKENMEATDKNGDHIPTTTIEDIYRLLSANLKDKSDVN